MLTNEQIKHIEQMSDGDKYQLACDTDNIDVLEYLSNDERWRIRYYIAHNDKVTIDILIKLSNDKDLDVRCRVARNEHTPTNILRKLSGDKHRSVRDEANAQLVKRKYEQSLINLNKHTTKGILE